MTWGRYLKTLKELRGGNISQFSDIIEDKVTIYIGRWDSILEGRVTFEPFLRKLHIIADEKHKTYLIEYAQKSESIIFKLDGGPHSDTNECNSCKAKSNYEEFRGIAL